MQDNGIAVAMCLAILNSSNEIKHPKLEILLTSDEEVGMSGAENVDISLLEGKKNDKHRYRRSIKSLCK